MQTATAFAPTASAPVFNAALTPSELRVTPSASAKMAELLREVDDDGIVAIRMFVSGGGCSGMGYGMTFTQQQAPTDAVLEGANFCLVADPMALQYLRGVEIDYQEGPRGASFLFNNAFNFSGGKGTCGGCGSSGGGCG